MYSLGVVERQNKHDFDKDLGAPLREARSTMSKLQEAMKLKPAASLYQVEAAPTTNSQHRRRVKQVEAAYKLILARTEAIRKAFEGVLDERAKLTLNLTELTDALRERKGWVCADSDAIDSGTKDRRKELVHRGSSEFWDEPVEILPWRRFGWDGAVVDPNFSSNLTGPEEEAEAITTRKLLDAVQATVSRFSVGCSISRQDFERWRSFVNRLQNETSSLLRAIDDLKSGSTDICVDGTVVMTRARIEYLDAKLLKPVDEWLELTKGYFDIKF